MIWTDVISYVTLGLFAVVLLSWLLNLLLLALKKPSSILLSRIMYVAALVAAVLSSIRTAVVYTEKTLLVANIVVLVCVIISFRRAERLHKYGPEPDDDEEEN